MNCVQVGGPGLLDSLIPYPADYSGSNNPFQLGGAEEQRAARNLLINRKLGPADLTTCRSRLKKRKQKLCIEESRLLWRAGREAGPRPGRARKPAARLQYAGRYQAACSGAQQYILTETEPQSVES